MLQTTEPERFEQGVCPGRALPVSGTSGERDDHEQACRMLHPSFPDVPALWCPFSSGHVRRPAASNRLVGKTARGAGVEGGGLYVQHVVARTFTVTTACKDDLRLQ